MQRKRLPKLVHIYRAVMIKFSPIYLLITWVIWSSNSNISSVMSFGCLELAKEMKTTYLRLILFISTNTTWKKSIWFMRSVGHVVGLKKNKESLKKRRRSSCRAWEEWDYFEEKFLNFIFIYVWYIYNFFKL